MLKKEVDALLTISVAYYSVITDGEQSPIFEFTCCSEIISS